MTSGELREGLPGRGAAGAEAWGRPSRGLLQEAVELGALPSHIVSLLPTGLHAAMLSSSAQDPEVPRLHSSPRGHANGGTSPGLSAAHLWRKSYLMKLALSPSSRAPCPSDACFLGPGQEEKENKPIQKGLHCSQSVTHTETGTLVPHSALPPSGPRSDSQQLPHKPFSCCEAQALSPDKASDSPRASRPLPSGSRWEGAS